MSARPPARWVARAAARGAAGELALAVGRRAACARLPSQLSPTAPPFAPPHRTAPHPPPPAEPYDGERVRFASRVAAVGAGWVELERPLLYDMRLEWQVGVWRRERLGWQVGVWRRERLGWQVGCGGGMWQAGWVALKQRAAELR